ncbi:MAG: hypothetical protein HF982_14220 [Desulfobacteraceae bacterium]|nr:hypothetical protein [Desulfobacteraceae bacterium]MBC2720713.1 polysaccharide biosynthesis/export family protein [Desulfobacteraceae bacterium]
MQHLKSLFVFLLVIISLGLLITIPSSIRAQSDYILGLEDILEIIVWGHGDLKRKMPISLEGRISFPLIGEVEAAGKTTQQLEKDIAKKLADGYIIHPQVTITVSEYKSQKFFIIGEVKSQGKYDLAPGTTVLMAISIGGGMTEKAAPRRTKIIREENGKKKEFRVTMDNIVQPNDTIIIPESFF